MEKIGLFIVTFISRMPFAVMYVLSDVAAFILYHIVRYRRAVVRNNLMRCFPSRSLKEIKKIEKEFYVSFTDVILEIVKSFTISREEIEKRFSIENEEQLRSYFKDGHDNIMIFGHCFNWEWLMFLKVLMPDMEALALYQRIENHEVNEFMKKTRQRFGMRVVESRVSLLELSRLPNSGNTMIAFVADQSPARTLIKHWVKLFGQITPAHIGAHDIATRLKFGVVFLYMKRVSRGHYTVCAEKIYTPGDEVEKYDIIDKFYTRLERQIEENPTCWLWTHRRWKYEGEYQKVIEKKEKDKK